MDADVISEDGSYESPISSKHHQQVLYSRKTINEAKKATTRM
jgi:hypothetical protein